MDSDDVAWSGSLPDIPDIAATFPEHELLTVAYFAAASRRLRPPEQFLPELTPILRDGADWASLLQRRTAWLDGLLATDRRLGIIGGDFELDGHKAAFVWNSPAAVQWSGNGTALNLEEPFDTAFQASPEDLGPLSKFLKERKSQPETVLVWPNPYLTSSDMVEKLLMMFFEGLPVDSKLCMHVLPSVPEFCCSETWRQAGLAQIKWHKVLRQGDTWQNWVVETVSEEGFATLRRQAIIANIGSKGTGKGPKPPPPKASPPKASSSENTRAVARDDTQPKAPDTIFAIERPKNSDKGGKIRFTSEHAPTGSLPLALLARHLTDTGRHQKDVEISYAILCLGRLRALRYELERFNGATRPADSQRFLEICSSCGLKAGERPVRIDGLQELITTLEGEVEDLETMREEMECGRASFLALAEVFYPGAQVYKEVEGLGEVVGLTVLQSWYQLQNTLFGPEKTFHVEFEFVACVGATFARINFQEPFSAYKGVRSLDTLLYQRMTPELMERLHKRGEKYAAAAASVPYVQYSRGSFFAHSHVKHAKLAGGRVMLDTRRGHERGHNAARGGDYCSVALQQAMRTYVLQQKHGTEALRIVSSLGTDEVWMTWPALVGFSFTAKCWGQVLVADTMPITFREEAFNELVLASERKEMIRAAVRHSASSGLDFIEGKGDNTIILLHGPPGCGKTLTAEAIAEMLRMPLYVVTAGDLGITANEVEQKLSEVLQLCNEWNALVLIDEADVFLETRSSSELQRNALVCVMLRLLEYHQGVLFLTTNRASNIDPAVRSRITVSLRYDALSEAGRKEVWSRLLAKLPNAAADPANLARYMLNGRQIKNCLLLANSLAAERGEVVSESLIERAAMVVGDSDPQQQLQQEGHSKVVNGLRSAVGAGRLLGDGLQS